jgi:hypothetical protein
MERKTVYSAYDRRVVFEGTAEECREYIMNQAETVMDDGRVICRLWTMDGDNYWDVGPVFIFNA